VVSDDETILVVFTKVACLTEFYSKNYGATTGMFRKQLYCEPSVSTTYPKMVNLKESVVWMGVGAGCFSLAYEWVSLPVSGGVTTAGQQVASPKRNVAGPDWSLWKFSAVAHAPLDKPTDGNGTLIFNLNRQNPWFFGESLRLKPLPTASDIAKIKAAIGKETKPLAAVAKECGFHHKALQKFAENNPSIFSVTKDAAGKMFLAVK
jgi:hypothetical protein